MNWSGFGPALLSTFLGAALAAVLAIPAGLFLDRTQRLRTARKDVQQAASILSKALGANAERLAALAGILGRKADIIEELLGLELDAETWETVRPLVGEHLPVDLAASLSRHFSGARWVERAVEVLIRGAVNPELARAIEHPSLPEDLKGVRGDDAQRGLQRAHLGVLSLRRELSSRTGHLAKDAFQLRQRLDNVALWTSRPRATDAQPPKRSDN